ncbi:LrgB family protein, partial [Salmonella enterica subsp. enterica serovar Alachua]|nr:LrgB family protein [Salmonella enterica subsp. enterica serovar Alachua]
MPLSNPYVAMLFWSAATILLYLAAKRVYRRFPMWWLTPLA